MPADAVAGYGAVLKMAGLTVATATDITIRARRESIDVTDLGSYLLQRVGGPLDLSVTGTANYSSFANSILSRVHTMAGNGASAAISVTDSNGSQVLAGDGYLIEGGLALPKGAVTQPFEFHLFSCTIP